MYEFDEVLAFDDSSDGELKTDVKDDSVPENKFRNSGEEIE